MENIISQNFITFRSYADFECRNENLNDTSDVSQVENKNTKHYKKALTKWIFYI